MYECNVNSISCQEHSTGSTTNKRWYRCRRQRGYRRKGLGTDGRPVRAHRQLKDKKEYIGCGCQARFRKTVCLYNIVHLWNVLMIYVHPVIG